MSDDDKVGKNFGISIPKISTFKPPAFKPSESMLQMQREAQGIADRIAGQRQAHEEALNAVWEAKQAERHQEEERIDRERRALEISEALLESQRSLAEGQAKLVQTQDAQGAAARRNELIQYAVLVVAVLTLIVTVVTLL